MRLIIQKFGGSSLSSHELRAKAIEHIVFARTEGYAPVVVVSAMGRIGDPYATDTFLELLSNVSSSFPQRETDLVISCGEVISAAVMAGQLAGAGVKTVALNGAQAGIITDGTFGQAEIIRIKKDKILRLAQDGVVPIVAGFQGSSEEGEINTLGRGGSDTTAVALGAALEADVVEIYSDVDTVMTADPRLVPDAKPIENIGYQEVLQMAREGAKVIHPRAVDIALQYNLPLRLRRTGSDHHGTLVTHKKPQMDKAFISREKVVTGITHVAGLAQVRILTQETSGSEIETLLQRLSQAGVSIDLINFSPYEKMFTVPAADKAKVEKVFAALEHEVNVKAGYAKVSVVGAGMRGIPGVMARVVSAMNRARAEILQTADSHLTISCLIPEEKVAAAVKTLHLEFHLNE